MPTARYDSAMPKRSSKPTKRAKSDHIEIAARILAEATGEKPKTPVIPPPDDSGKNPAAVALGRLGGLKGGRARAAKLSKKTRREIAQKAAKARWGAEQPRKAPSGCNRVRPW